MVKLVTKFFAIPVLLISITYPQNYYLGTGDATTSGLTCYTCHQNNVWAEWNQTAHATAHVDLLSNPGYGYDCLKCHNTGWDVFKDNYGADEYVVEDTTQSPNFVITDPINWYRVQNVGCEACHGPLGTINRDLSLTHWTTAPDYSVMPCGGCHQDEHHPYIEEWSLSKHSTFPSSIPNWTDRSVRGACYKCHHAQDFVAYLDDPNYDPYTFDPGNTLVNVTCAACHDPHNNQNEGQLRVPTTGQQAICDVCHTSEIDQVNIYTTPHHNSSECFDGSENFGYQYPGVNFPNSIHTIAALNRCIDCHVYMTPFTPGNPAKTGHTFYPRIEACEQCHLDYLNDPNIDPNNEETWFNYRNTQHQIDSLMQVLEEELSQLNPNLTHNQALGFQYNAALYNYESVLGEGSRGIHNTKLVKELLIQSILRFDPTDVTDENGLPEEFNLSQNYPNPFNPATEISFTLPVEGEVSLVVYDVLGNKIETLVNETKPAGTYRITWNGTNYSSGVYYYRMESGNFVQTKKMLLIK